MTKNDKVAKDQAALEAAQPVPAVDPVVASAPVVIDPAPMVDPLTNKENRHPEHVAARREHELAHPYSAAEPSDPVAQAVRHKDKDWEPHHVHVPTVAFSQAEMGPGDSTVVLTFNTPAEAKTFHDSCVTHLERHKRDSSFVAPEPVVDDKPTDPLGFPVAGS